MIVIERKTSLKALVGNLLQIAPKIKDLINSLEGMVLVVLHADIDDLITISIAIEKFVL